LNILEEEESKFLRQRDADRVEKTIQRSNAIVTRMAIEDHVWKRKLAAYDEINPKDFMFSKMLT